MTTADHLRQSAPEILRQWEATVRAAAPAARRKSRPVLLDSIPAFVEQLARALERRVSTERGAPETSREHVLQRSALPAYSLDQVVMEYSILRQTILSVLEASSPLQPGDLSVVLHTVDLGMREAATHYIDVHEAALRASEERFRLLVASVRDYAIFMLDPAGNVVSWNRGAERLKGYTEEEILGRHFSVFYTAEDVRLGRPDEYLRAAARDGRIEDEGWRVRKDGTLFWADVVITAVRDEAAQLRGFAKVTRDVTERRRIEEDRRRHSEALQEASRRKDEFLAMLGHELRNPLSPIRAAVEILRLGGRVATEDRRLLDVIDRQVGHLTRLVDDLLDAARLTQGRLQLRRERVELGRLVEQAAEIVRPFIASRGQELVVSIADGPTFIDADPTRITQAVTNVLHNASKFTPQLGRIWLTASREEGHTAVRVRDSGVGIDAEMMPHIFDLFVHGGRPGERGQDGLGIGLALARRIVAMHGGTLEAHSAGLEMGTEFVMRLPLLAGQEMPAPALAEGQGPPARPLDVLVIDDNADAAGTVAEVLRLWGHHVTVAHTGEEALEVAGARPHDVVVVDLGLPTMSGYEVARALRQLHPSRNLCLVALTGFGQQSDLERTRAERFDGHLTKPVDLEALRAILEACP